MDVIVCALGVIQARGDSQVAPSVVEVGAPEQDYLARHVTEVRKLSDSRARALVDLGSPLTDQLSTLLETEDEHDFATIGGELQAALAHSMGRTSNAKDCVFAIVVTGDGGVPHHVSLLKLDAVVEAARMQRLREGGVSFKVLKGLLPEPGLLQKALSWPDGRPDSDVIMIDKNFQKAQYFEDAFAVRVSPRSTEAEAELADVIYRSVPPSRIAEISNRLSRLEGPSDQVLRTVSAEFPDIPELSAHAAEQPEPHRPAGFIRANKIAARPVVWKAEGLKLEVSPSLAGAVEVAQLDDGWELRVRTQGEPRISGT